MVKPTFVYEYDDSNDEDYEPEKREAALKAVLMNNNYCDVDGIVIHTYYLDRITDELLKIIKPIAMCDDDNLIIYKEDPIIDTLKKCKLGDCGDCGYFVFNNKKAIDLFELVERLEKADYCAMCDVENISNCSWFNVDNKTILYCSIDTESG